MLSKETVSDHAKTHVLFGGEVFGSSTGPGNTASRRDMICGHRVSQIQQHTSVSDVIHRRQLGRLQVSNE